MKRNLSISTTILSGKVIDNAKDGSNTSFSSQKSLQSTKSTNTIKPVQSTKQANSIKIMNKSEKKVK